MRRWRLHQLLASLAAAAAAANERRLSDEWAGLVTSSAHARPTNLQNILPRDAMRKRGLCCGSMYVRLSVTFVHCIQTAEDVRLLCQPGNPFILVFLTRNVDTQFQTEPLQRGAKFKGWENFAIFDWNRRLSRIRYERCPSLLWNVNRKSYALYRMVTFSMTLTDP